MTRGASSACVCARSPRQEGEAHGTSETGPLPRKMTAPEVHVAEHSRGDDAYAHSERGTGSGGGGAMPANDPDAVPEYVLVLDEVARALMHMDFLARWFEWDVGVWACV